MNSTEDCLLEPYLLGCLLGDGGLHGNLTFSSLDEDILFYVNQSLQLYGYYLKKRSRNKQRSSEYSIIPQENHTQKYKFIYNNIEYTTTEVLKKLQADGYAITSLDTLLSVTGYSTKSKKSNILKYFPDIREKLQCIKLRESQHSKFLDILNFYNLRVGFDQKRIPVCYLEADKQTKISLLQGLLDTDGCGADSAHRIEFCISNEGLANDMQILAESLGFKVKIYIKHAKYFSKKYNEYRSGHTAYRVVLSNDVNFEPFRCKRKLEAYNNTRYKNKKE